MTTIVIWFFVCGNTVNSRADVAFSIGIFTAILLELVAYLLLGLFLGGATDA